LADIPVPMEKSSEFGKSDFGVGDVSYTVCGMLEVGYPESFGVEGREEGVSWDGKRTSSADHD